MKTKVEIENKAIVESEESTSQKLTSASISESKESCKCRELSCAITECYNVINNFFCRVKDIQCKAEQEKRNCKKSILDDLGRIKLEYNDASQRLKSFNDDLLVGIEKKEFNNMLDQFNKLGDKIKQIKECVNDCSGNFCSFYTLEKNIKDIQFSELSKTLDEIKKIKAKEEIENIDKCDCMKCDKCSLWLFIIGIVLVVAACFLGKLGIDWYCTIFLLVLGSFMIVYSVRRHYSMVKGKEEIRRKIIEERIKFLSKIN